VVHGSLPPGTGFGSPRDALAATLGAPRFFALVVGFGLLVGAGWSVLRVLLRRRAGATPEAAAKALAPLFWGAAVPAFAPLVDSISFWCSAPPLAALGVGAGVVLATRRCVHLDGVCAPTFGRREGAVLAALAVLVPVALLAIGWSAPSGDEPHYLTVAHSLVTDGDLDVADDYRDRVYAPFHPTTMSPHYRPGVEEGSRYSMHGIGLPVIIAPGYALGRALGPAAMVALPRGMLALLYGLFAWVLYGFVSDVAPGRAALWGTAATTLLAPLLFAPLFVFSEVPAMLLSLVAFRGLCRAQTGGARHGLALAALPFMGVKYIPLAGAIWLAGVWAAPRRGRLRRALYSGAPLAVALLLHGLFTWRLYGSFSPAAIYLGAGDQAGAPALGGDWGAYVAAWPAAVATAIGYLLDQKDGLLAYGPHFILSSVGLGWLCRHRRRLFLSLLLIGAAYVGPYALSQQLGGQGPPVRPLMAILWILAPALGVALARVTECRGYAVLRSGLLTLSASLTLAYMSAPELLPHDYPVGASRLVQNYSPYGSAWWRLFPQWVNIDDPNVLVTGLWTLVALLLAAALWRYGWRAEITSGDGEPLSRGSTDVRGWGWNAALAVVLIACALVLIHHVAIVRTDRHRPTPMDSGLVAWVAEELPPVAFAEAGGVWAKPGEPVDVILTSDDELGSVDVVLRVLVPAQVFASVQGAVLAGPAAPGADLVDRLRPGRGRADGPGYAYHVRLLASAGAAPADLFGGTDERHLGVFFQPIGR